MRKVFTSICVMALMVASSAFAQEAEKALEAQAAETVEAVVAEASAPAEEVAPAVADAQESVSDGVALEATPLPVAADVIYDTGVVFGGGCSGCQQPVVEAFVPSSCCNSCCGEASFVQPVVFNQPVFQESVISQSVPAIQASAASIVNPAPVPAAPVYSQPVTAGCSSCSGGGVVNYAPTAVTTSPVTTTFSPAPVTAAPVTSSYVSAPVASSGCSACAQSAPVATDCCCQQSGGLFRSGGGLFRSGGLMGGRITSRFRNAAIAEAIDN